DQAGKEGIVLKVSRKTLGLRSQIFQTAAVGNTDLVTDVKGFKQIKGRRAAASEDQTGTTVVPVYILLKGEAAARNMGCRGTDWHNLFNCEHNSEFLENQFQALRKNAPEPYPEHFLPLFWSPDIPAQLRFFQRDLPADGNCWLLMIKCEVSAFMKDGINMIAVQQLYPHSQLHGTEAVIAKQLACLANRAAEVSVVTAKIELAEISYEGVDVCLRKRKLAEDMEYHKRMAEEHAEKFKRCKRQWDAIFEEAGQ
ncbi:unnamed protein product, partial [Symbiodinium sp. CCMP2456]